MPALDGPRLKLDRAWDQIHVLEPETELWIKKNKYKLVIADLNPHTDRYALRVLEGAGNSAPPLEWGVRIGEIVHDLRSALDGLVWQLALLNGWTERRLMARRPKLEFPVYVRSKRQHPRWCDGQVRALLRPLEATHASGIERVQPYKRRNGGRSNRLWRLHELNNADKHRLLQTAAIGANWAGFAYWGEDDSPTGAFSLNLRRPLIHGTNVGSVSRFLIEEMKVDHFTIGHGVAFGEGCRAVRGLPVVSFLRNTHQAVTEIVETFAPDLG